MMSSFFIHKPFSQSLQVCSHFVSFFLAVSRQYAAAMFDFTQLFISFTLRQVVSGLQAMFFSCRKVFLGRFECFLRLLEFQVAGAVSSDFKFLDARNLTCLQPLPIGLYYKTVV